jgi:hypothetical protein
MTKESLLQKQQLSIAIPHANRISLAFLFPGRCRLSLIANAKIQVTIALTPADTAGVSASADRDGSQFAD